MEVSLAKLPLIFPVAKLLFIFFLPIDSPHRNHPLSDTQTPTHTHREICPVVLSRETLRSNKLALREKSLQLNKLKPRMTYTRLHIFLSSSSGIVNTTTMYE